MKGVGIFLFLLAAGEFFLCGQTADGSGTGDRVVMFWNLENFYDYIDQGTGASDAEFSSFGARRWTKSRFRAKCDAVAKMILWVGDRYGSIPAVVGFAEVENGRVVRRLVEDTALWKFGYRVVHYDSPDSRGIDVALIYRDDVFELLSSKPCHVYTNEKMIMKTRDILLVSLRDRRSGEVTHFAVNHHPSKYGGEAVSRPKRLAAMTRLRDICDSVITPDSGSLIAMGDFNDTPDNPLFGIFGDSMVNKALPLFRKGEGTIKYQGRWELIDMFIISSELSDKYRMEIVRAPFHLQRDTAHVGEKPFRTYSGPRYIGGVSDHFPIVLLPEVVSQAEADGTGRREEMEKRLENRAELVTLGPLKRQ